MAHRKNGACQWWFQVVRMLLSFEDGVQKVLMDGSEDRRWVGAGGGKNGLGSDNTHAHSRLWAHYERHQATAFGCTPEGRDSGFDSHLERGLGAGGGVRIPGWPFHFILFRGVVNGATSPVGDHALFEPMVDVEPPLVPPGFLALRGLHAPRWVRAQRAFLRHGSRRSGGRQLRPGHSRRPGHGSGDGVRPGGQRRNTG